MFLLNATFEAVGAALAWHGAMSSYDQGTAASLALGWSALWACECVGYYIRVGDRLSAGLAAVRAAGAVVWVL